MKSIYNEGRVVGLSAYEIYVKQFLQDHPDEEPATEREWLASTLAMGSSMMLVLSSATVPSGSGFGVVDIPLPAGSKLCAANTLIASYVFCEGERIAAPETATSQYGTAKYAWFKNLTDFGNNLVNSASQPPSQYIDTNFITTIPPKTQEGVVGPPSEWTKLQLRGYMSIVDGIVIQPGTWSPSQSGTHKDFEPDLSKPPVIRLIYNKAIRRTQILLTGFSIATVVKGESNVEGGSMNTDHPENGDFLGPQAYPWANKIIFSIPSEISSYFYINNFQRRIPDAESDPKRIEQISIIDGKSSQASTYYNDHSASVVDEAVSELNALNSYTVTSYQEGDPVPPPPPQDPGANVLTLYSRRGSNAPSALYESVVLVPDTLLVTNQDGTSTVNQRSQTVKLYPVDVVAPGTVKLFQGANNATNQGKVTSLETNESENYGFIRTNDYIVFQKNGSSFIPVSDVTASDINHDVIISGSSKAQKATITSGMHSQDALIVPSGSITIPSNNLSVDYIYWAALLEGLANNKKLDVLGEKLRNLKTALASLAQGRYIISVNSSGVVSVVGFDTTSAANSKNYIVVKNADGTYSLSEYTWGNALSSAANSTDYIITKDSSGNVTLKKYSEATYDFGVFHITLTPHDESGSQKFYSSGYIDIFKYSSGNNIQSFGTLEQTRNESHFNVTGANWGQTYSIGGDYGNLFWLYPHIVNGVRVPTDCIKVEVVPRPSFHSDTTPKGAPTSNTMVVMTCYLGFGDYSQTGTGEYRAIVFNRNNGLVQFIPTSSNYQISIVDYWGHSDIPGQYKGGFTWTD